MNLLPTALMDPPWEARQNDEQEDPEIIYSPCFHQIERRFMKHSNLWEDQSRNMSRQLELLLQFLLGLKIGSM